MSRKPTKKSPEVEVDQLLQESKELGSVKYKIVKDSSFSIGEIEAVLKGSVIENITGDALDKITFWLTMANKNKAIFTVTLKKGWMEPKVSFKEGIDQSIRLDDQIKESV